MTNYNEDQLNNLKFENTMLKKVVTELIEKFDLMSIHALAIKYGITYDNYLSLLGLLGTSQRTLSISDITEFFNGADDRYDELTDKDTLNILHALKNADIMVEKVSAILTKNKE